MFSNLGWFGSGLLVADLGLLLTLATSPSERLWRVFRRPALLAFQVAGVLIVTWLIVTYAAQSAGSGAAALVPGQARLSPSDTALLARPVGDLIRTSAQLSLLTLAYALSFSSLAGLVGAILVSSGERGRWTALGPVATLLWVAPTFLIAILVQELQGWIYGESGLRVAAGFAEVNSIQIFWVSFILAVRPTAYFFQQARNALDLDVTTDYVRTARAKGLSWPQVVRHHVLRANAALILTAWLNSFRSMIGSAPLVEFLFGYPGLGRVLVLALGLSYGTGLGPVHVDVATGLVVVLALLLIAIETATSILERMAEPRLRTLGAAPV